MDENKADKKSVLNRDDNFFKVDWKRERYIRHLILTSFFSHFSLVYSESPNNLLLLLFLKTWEGISTVVQILPKDLSLESINYLISKTTKNIQASLSPGIKVNIFPDSM